MSFVRRLFFSISQNEQDKVVYEGSKLSFWKWCSNGKRLRVAQLESELVVSESARK